MKHFKSELAALGYLGFIERNNIRISDSQTGRIEFKLRLLL